ncbi:AzlC family ABC transporter permease [Arsenicicoccus dermatophilus]|uniref:AzlC family ABC transporter permease n=1 Tax=Arsenicicoccus dermatophilus TaxID=1076331 RepID=UPI001F4D0C75|nr:AzlC family ABC transporter permease [Arsenicicoccus dermatophilus]MCH8611726.1 AzlC family ABC transporter permease [Arsenicicoccus dermatophilus]
MTLTPATRMGLSISVAVGLYGLSFGALGVGAGLSVWQSCLLSLLMFTGGSQFGFMGVVAAGGAPTTALSTAVLLGVRNALYGIQMNAMLRPPWLLRPLQAHLTIDESTATALAQEDQTEQRRGFWTAGVGVFVLWNLFTLVGALAGDTIGDPTVCGLDGAAVAGFLGLLWPRLQDGDGRAIAVVCALACVLATPWLPSGVPIIMSGLVALTIGLATAHRHPAGGVHRPTTKDTA